VSTPERARQRLHHSIAYQQAHLARTNVIKAALETITNGSGPTGSRHTARTGGSFVPPVTATLHVGQSEASPNCAMGSGLEVYGRRKAANSNPELDFSFCCFCFVF